MPESAVGLMARFPRPNAVSPVIAEAIGEDRALDVYKRLLQKAVTLVVNLDRSRFMRAVFIEDPDLVDLFEIRHDGFDLYMPQSGIDRGARMKNALSELLRISGPKRALVIDAHVPDITPSIIGDADRLVSDRDLVIGPTRNGGIYLIGMKFIVPSIFDSIDWESGSGFEMITRRAELLEMKVGQLPELREAVSLKDLKHLSKSDPELSGVLGDPE